MFPPPGTFSAQDIDLQWATNVLGHFHLTNLLVPLLEKSSHKAEGFPRVVNTSSSGHWLLTTGDGIQFETLKPQGGKQLLDNYRLYGQSKLVRFSDLLPLIWPCATTAGPLLTLRVCTFFVLISRATCSLPTNSSVGTPTSSQRPSTPVT